MIPSRHSLIHANKRIHTQHLPSQQAFFRLWQQWTEMSVLITMGPFLFRLRCGVSHYVRKHTKREEPNQYCGSGRTLMIRMASIGTARKYLNSAANYFISAQNFAVGEGLWTGWFLKIHSFGDSSIIEFRILACFESYIWTVNLFSLYGLSANFSLDNPHRVCRFHRS